MDFDAGFVGERVAAADTQYLVRGPAVLVQDDDGVEWLSCGPELGQFKGDHHECLWTFIRLADVASGEITAFAERWGSLELRALYPELGWDGLYQKMPRRHEDLMRKAQDVALASRNFRPFHRLLRYTFEPIAVWRRLASHFKAVLAIMNSLGDGRTVDESDWLRVVSDLDKGLCASIIVTGTGYLRLSTLLHPPKDPSDFTYQMEVMDAFTLLDRPPNWSPEFTVGEPINALPMRWQRELLALVVDLWIGYAKLALHLDWNEEDGRYTLKAAYRSLLAVLVAQLSTAMTSHIGVYRCDGCGYSYHPSKRPQPHEKRRRYCTTCSGGGLRLGAKRDYYYRRKAKKQAEAQTEEGSSVEAR